MTTRHAGQTLCSGDKKRQLFDFRAGKATIYCLVPVPAKAHFFLNQRVTTLLEMARLVLNPSSGIADL
jgi:hypothetical protein